MERRELHRGMEDALRRAEELATQKEHQVEEAMAREANARQHAKEAERTARELEMISDQERMAREGQGMGRRQQTTRTRAISAHKSRGVPRTFGTPRSRAGSG
eukprot:TRINITY_DN46322_c0_g1_i1.p3 TRINITY_DN46322_c0_g1~~TRINITY_DN46322_c0_g1_i1.p3  ORF type:complete len:103 (-),score=16.32 TRINITY_DN46322_c0_g1_i1:373-681(-)